MWYGIGLSSWERRACLVASIRVASYRRAEHGDAQLFGQSRTLRVKQLLGLESSMANPDLAAPNAAILPNDNFHVISRAARPSCNQLRKSSNATSHVRKINRSSNLWQRVVRDRLSICVSMRCGDWATLDDFRNWRFRRLVPIERQSTVPCAGLRPDPLR
jgi:hypothetical protein